MSDPRVLLEWDFTPDYDDATPERFRLREGRCGTPPLVEWRDGQGEWLSGLVVGWTDEAILAEFARLAREVEGWRTERNRLAAALAETTTREEVGRERVAALEYFLRIYVTAHQHGDSVPSVLEAEALEALGDAATLAALGEVAKNG